MGEQDRVNEKRIMQAGILDSEWIHLMIMAQRLGLSTEEIRLYLREIAAAGESEL